MDNIPYGYCQCGCGRETNLAKKTDRTSGRVEGEPMRYLRGHSSRKYTHETHAEFRQLYTQNLPEGIEWGECFCGCGQNTRRVQCTDFSKGWLKGHPLRYIHGHQHRHPLCYEVEDRGYKTLCWIWQGRTHNGYAVAGTPRQRIHRVFYERKYGPIPSELEPDHLCRVKACINPDHIEPVTHKENTRRSERVRLSMKKAREIRRIAATTNLSYAAIGRMFGVYGNSVRLIVLNRQWKEQP